MAEKKLTPEEVAAQAEKAKAAKAAAKSDKPSAQEMSGGVVKGPEKPDAASQGVSAMEKYVAAPLMNAYSLVANPLGSTVDNLKGLYNSVAADPNAAPYEPTLPKAKANFWEQVPAALSDVGNYASRALRSAGDSVSGVLNNFEPYTYLRDANKAVGDYFTPSFMQGSNAASSEPALQPEPQPEPAQRSIEGPLPKNTEQLEDGRLQQKLYGRDGTYRGTATGTMEQMDLLAKPSELELQERARQQVEDNVQRNLFERQVRQDREWRERTSPEAAEQFFARANSKRAFEDAANRGSSKDPARNAFLVENILRSAQNQSRATGQSVDEILSADKYADTRNVQIARGLAQQEAQLGQPLTTQQIGQQALALAPSSAVNRQSDDETLQQSLEKQAAAKLNPAADAQGSLATKSMQGQQLKLDTAKFLADQAKDQASAEADTAKSATDQQKLAEWRVNTAIGNLQEGLKLRSSALSILTSDKAFDPEVKAQAQAQLQAADQVLKMWAEQAKSVGIPEDYLNNMLGQGAQTATETLPEVPPDKSQLEVGKVYQTKRGPAVWNGNNFELAQTPSA